MQQSLQKMIGFTVLAADGNVGKIDEVYFDDSSWTVCYLVVDTNSWLSDRKVLIAQVAFGKPDWELHSFPVNLTREQVRNSPDVDTTRPIHHQHEALLQEYYRGSSYGDAGHEGSINSTLSTLSKKPLGNIALSALDRDEAPHLRRLGQIINYTIHASDGVVGHVGDFVVNDENWFLYFLVVTMGNLMPGKQILIPPSWITHINWATAEVYLDRTQEEVTSRPELSTLK